MSHEDSLISKYRLAKDRSQVIHLGFFCPKSTLRAKKVSLVCLIYLLHQHIGQSHNPLRGQEVTGFMSNHFQTALFPEFSNSLCGVDMASSPAYSEFMFLSFCDTKLYFH